MDKQGLLFIPDISGFTRFINATDIEHSRLIIQELLEQLISSNELDLEVSEIEGDAILFYKFGPAPQPEILYRQVEKMFCDFHRALLAYDQRRFCQCEACMSAVGLSLKIITHYGEFTSYNVRNFNKLIGKDVIVAHQLLKNEISEHEYWLLTKNVQQEPVPAFHKWMVWDSSVKQTESGDITFRYTQLTKLKESISVAPPVDPDLSGKTKMISISKEYETGIIPLFHLSGDFHNRAAWQQGVKEVQELNHFLPRVGMRCRCIMENGKTSIYSSSYSYRPERIVFGETNENNHHTTSFCLEKTGDNTTKLRLDYYIPKKLFAETIFNLFHKKKMAGSMQQSLLNLQNLVRDSAAANTTIPS